MQFGVKNFIRLTLRYSFFFIIYVAASDLLVESFFSNPFNYFETLFLKCSLYILGLTAVLYFFASNKSKNKEHELFEEIRLQSFLLNAVGQAAIATDMLGLITYWNKSAENLFGWAKDEVIGLNIIDITSLESNKKQAHAIIESLKKGNSWSGEISVKRKDGSSFLALITTTPVCDEHKIQIGTVGICQDISDQKKLEENLKERESRWRALLDTIPELIWIKDPNGVYLGCNPEFEKFFGADEKTIIGKTDYDFVNKKLADFFRMHDKIALDNKQLMINEEEIIYASDGHKATIETIKTPVFDEKNNLIGVLGIGRDITKRKEAEQEIRKLSTAIEQSPLSVVITDSTGNIEYANPRFFEITGYTKSEVLGRNPRFLNSGEQPRNYYRAMWKTIKRGAVWQGEFKNRKKNGELFWEDATIGSVMDEDNNIIQYVALKQDITRQKRAESALFLEKHMLDSIMNNMTDLIYYKDDKSRFVRVNKAMAQRAGYKDPADLYLRTDFDLYSEAYAEKAYNDEQIVMQNDQAMKIEETEVWNDGRSLWVSTVKAPLHDESGKVVGTFGISRDITDKKNYEDVLKQNEDRLRKILESVAAGIVIANFEDKRINYVNSAALKLFNRKRDEVINHAVPEFIIDPSAGNSGIDNNETIADCYVLLPDKEKFPILKSAVRIIVDGKNQLIESFVDIKKLKETESALAQAQKLESIGQLAAGIAHEINTPIQYVGDNTHFLKNSFEDLLQLLNLFNDIKTNAEDAPCKGELYNKIEILENEIDMNFLKDEIPAAIEQSLEGVNRISKIVKALKEFSHPGNKEKTSIDVNRAISNTITVSRNEWKYVAELETDFQPDLPPVMLYPDEFNQVILNIIINAAHAIAAKDGSKEEKGKIIVKTLQNGNMVEVHISDNGVGIPDEIRKKIFDPFFTTKEIGKGTGQGLAISHDIIVNKHKGKIDFVSYSGKGTEFILQLPL